MPGSAGKKRKAKNAGVGIDFKRARHKVGKKLPKPQNATNTNFKSRAITLPAQTIGEEKGAAVTKNNLTLQDLMGQSGHYSPKVRHQAIQGLSELISNHPGVLKNQVGVLLEKLADRVADPDKDVRGALKGLLAKHVLPSINGDMLDPFLPLLMAHVCSAMTHLDSNIRGDSLGILEELTAAAPATITTHYFEPATALFANLLSPTARHRSISKKALLDLLEVLRSLKRFFLQVCTQQAQSANSSPEPEFSSTGSYLENNGFSSHKQDPCPAAKGLASQKRMAEATTDKLQESLKELAGHLVVAWTECNSVEFREQEETALAAAESTLSCLRMVLEELQTSPSSTGEANEKLAKIVVSKVAPGLPLVPLAGQMSEKSLALMMHANLAGMQLFASILRRGSLKISTGKETSWIIMLLDYYAAVLLGGIAVGSSSKDLDGIQQPTIPVDCYKEVLLGVEQVLPSVSAPRRRQLLAGITSLSARSSAKSATKSVCLATISRMLARPLRYLCTGPSGPAVIAEAEVAQWLEGLPKLLWELSKARSKSSHLALRILFDAARFAQPKGAVTAALVSLQPAFALFYCTQVAAKPWVSEHDRAGLTKEAGKQLLSPFAKLPSETQVLAVDLLYYLPAIDPALLKSLRLLCQAGIVPGDVASRIVSVVSAKMANDSQQSSLLDFLMSVLEALEDDKKPAAVSLQLRLAQALADLNSEDFPVLQLLDSRLIIAACSRSASSPLLLGTLAAVLQISECQKRLHRFAAELSEAEADQLSQEEVPENAFQPGEDGSGRQEKNAPESQVTPAMTTLDLEGLSPGLAAALPIGLCEAVVRLRRDESGASGALEGGISQAVTNIFQRLLFALPSLTGPFLQSLPEACVSSLEHSGGTRQETGGAANRIQAAANALLGLCSREEILRLLAPYKSELQSASQKLSRLNDELQHDNPASQASSSACQQLIATVRRLTGTVEKS